ncbi:MAG: hypothetical protein ACE5NW_05400 [Acidiferrobacterales bacterium]
MVQLRKQAKMGARWLDCGRRLVKRNPWLLSGMALAAMAIIILLTLIPLLGRLLIALTIPLLAASALLTVHDLSRQKIALPTSLKFAALARAPKELVRVITHEKHVMTVLMVSIYTLAVVLLINILAHLISDGAWIGNLWTLDTVTLFSALVTRLVALVLYLGLALSLVYAIPLIFLQDQALVPALSQSFRAAGRHIVAVLVIMGVLLAPFILGTLTSTVSRTATYLIWFVGGTLVLPVFVASCYCSYRTVFPAEQVVTGRHPANWP